VATVLLVLGTFSCAKPTEPTQLIEEPTVEPNRLTSKLAEVSPPETIQILKQVIDAYTPQVRILSPRPGEVVEDTSVSLRVQVRGLPLFQDETFGLGPHLHVFLDNEPYKAVYDLSKPLEFKDLAPGTHTLRVFASRPWHESFKNQGAFDQRTFHIYAPTPQDELSAEKPVLTYSRPQGNYGAEPIMLDFYLTNAPLHMTAQEDPKDDIHDWRIRCTVNGQSFVFDEWQAVYLKGFEPGRNWVQLELIDEAGNPIDNRFNNTVRVIDYEPGGDDTLSKLVRGELGIKEVAGIIDPTYEPPAKPEPEPELEEVPPAVEAVTPEAEEGAPEVEEVAPEAEVPAAEQGKVPEAKEAAPVEAKETPEEAVQPEVPPETDTEEVAPAKPQPPASVTPPIAPEAAQPTTPKSPEPSDLAPEVTPKELQQGSTPQAPQAEEEELQTEQAGESQSAAATPVEPEAPAPDLNPPDEPQTEDIKTAEPTPSKREGMPAQPGKGDDTLQAPASLSTEKTKEQDIEASEQTQSADEDVAIPSQQENTNGVMPQQPAQSDELDKAAESSPGNKLLERYKRWQRRRQAAQSEVKTPTPEPESDRVDVFLSPQSEEAAPAPDMTQDSDSQQDDRMDMPDLVEPYLTEPYLTEPRLDLLLPEEEGTDQQEDNPLEDADEGAEAKQPAATNPDRPFI
jgi:hypothetical protein